MPCKLKFNYIKSISKWELAVSLGCGASTNESQNSVKLSGHKLYTNIFMYMYIQIAFHSTV